MIRKDILNQLDINEITIKDLALKIKADYSTVRKYLNHDTDEISFESLLAIAKLLFPDTEKETLSKWVPQLEWIKNLRMAMEYSSINRMLNVLETLTNLDINNKEFKEWANMYKIVLHYQRRDKSPQELSDMIDSTTSTKEEMIILKSLLRCYVMYRTEEYKSFFRAAKAIEKRIEGIKNVFIRTSYTVRLCEMFANGYLYANNDPKKARFYANNVISKNISAKFTSDSVYIVGMSFLFDDYSKCIDNLTTCYEMLKKDNRHDIAKLVKDTGVDFAKIVWGRDLETVGTKNISEQAHLNAKLGNRELALDLLDKAEELEGTSAFKMYYRGLINNDTSLLWQSCGKFIASGNLFFANLPRKALENSPFQVAADALFSTIQIA